ncbi:MAG: hypothetical protein Q9165_005944, partial [Trypethelium subeluteriae]
FILYRQHSQAKVIQQHPGLANPEISKIIGEQWRAQPDEVKDEWKRLADEEKIRHQQQYPDYRYQPRRTGRSGSEISSPSTSPNKARCSKCGGRSIITPITQTPPARRNTPPNSSHPVLPPPTSGSALTPTTRFLPMLNNLSLQSPQGRRIHRPGPVPTAAIQAAALRERQQDTDVQMTSPDAKRRRYDQGAYNPMGRRPQPGTPYPFPVASPNSSGSRRESLPRVDTLLRGSSPNGPMGPPPRPGHHPGSYPDLSLNLPPLQNTTSPRSAGSDKPQQSLDSIVKGMNPLAKISLLGKIAPPLKSIASAITSGITSGTTSGTTSETTTPRDPPKKRTRGAVVAIEGDTVEAVNSLAKWLFTDLSDSKDLHVKGVDGVEAPSKPPELEEGEVTPTNKPHRQPSLNDYLRVISDWHTTSQDVVRFVRGEWSRLSDGSVQLQDPDEPSSEDEEREGKRRVTPVVIIPSYQLFASDTYASRVPISDAYSPADHWQWMATLWRGTVGPDITVYVRDCGPEELARDKLFEVRDEIRCLIVRRDKNNEEGTVGQPALRRVSFEIAEWVRAINVGKGEEKY